MTFLQSGLATRDDRFRLRVHACLYKLAQDVRSEPPDAENHAARVTLADSIVNGGWVPLDRFVWLCAANPTIAATVTETDGDVEVGAPDSDIEFVCASNWDIVALTLVSA